MTAISHALRPACRPACRRAWRPVAGGILFLLLAGGACRAADDVVQVSQRERAFTVPAVVVPLGGVVRFRNDDEFIHQIFIDASTMTYESDEQEPGKSVDVRFTKPGTFEVHCHIHPRMLLRVTVK